MGFQLCRELQEMFKVLAENNEMKPHKTSIFKLIFKQHVTLILWSGVQPMFSPFPACLGQCNTFQMGDNDFNGRSNESSSTCIFA